MSENAEQSLSEAVGHHLVDAGLPEDVGADERWVKMKIGPIPFAYPNTRARKKVLLAHDLHHVLAGYRTDLVGEAEMAAFELGSGMTDRSGVRYAIRVFGFGLAWQPRRVYRAFVRGRRCKNLLGRTLDDEFLGRSVADVRGELGMDAAPAEATAEDRRAFRTWAAKGIAIVWAPLLPLGAVAWWWLR